MSGDINVQTFSGKVNINNNLLVGSSHLFVDTVNNRVGITTASPGASLEVNGNVHVATDVTFGGTLTGDGSGLTNISNDSGSWVNGNNSNVHLATSTDKVGIGISSPDHKLHIYDNSSTDPVYLKIQSETYNRAGIILAEDSNDICIMEYDGTGADADNYLAFYSGISNWAAKGTGLNFIPYNGRVGIGTTSPTAQLHISSGNSGDCVLKIEADEDNNLETDNPRIEFISDGGYNTALVGAGQMPFENSNDNALVLAGLQMKFYTGVQDFTDSTNMTEKMRILANGNVGIGTTSPSGVLHVVDSSANSSWNKLLVRPTTLWGDGVTTAAEDGGGPNRYMTMANIMLQNPHVCCSTAGQNAHIRLGRGGGVPTGEWWDLATRTDNKFQICAGADPAKGIVIDTGGRVEFGESAKRNLYFNPSVWSYNTTSTSDTTLWSFTYNFPYDGYVILNTNGHWRNTSYGTWFYGKLGIDHADPADTSGLYDSYTGGAHSNHSGDFHEYEENLTYWCDFNWGGTLKVSAGTRTICLRVRISGGHIYINGTAVNMFYIPTKIF